MQDWTKAVLPYLGHVHLHNNDGWPDNHNALDDGEMDIEALLHLMLPGSADMTMTLEVRDSRHSMEWLVEKKLL